MKTLYSPLQDEHKHLGAQFYTDPFGIEMPDYYAHPENEPEALKDAAIVDTTNLRLFLIEGTQAQSYVSMVFSAEPLKVGELNLAPVLSGDGHVLSVCVLARTGDNEYLVISLPERAALLFDWMQSIAQIEQEGFKPFSEIKLEEVSGNLIPLYLTGKHIDAILADYLPKNLHTYPNTIIQTKLDKQTALLAHTSYKDTASYLVFLPQNVLAVFWRSFLSFPELTPVGNSALYALLDIVSCEMQAFFDDPSISKTPQELGINGLIRTSDGFIGQRALSL